MPAETFLVAFNDGYWRVNFDGQWYGAYPSRAAAQQATVIIAKAPGITCQRALSCVRLTVLRRWCGIPIKPPLIFPVGKDDAPSGKICLRLKNFGLHIHALPEL